jgi:beta-1,4-mannosyltransferase
MRRVRVLAFPYDFNPYQQLLYSSLPTSRCTVKYIHRLPYLGALAFPAVVTLRRLTGFRILHVHWPAFFIGPPIPYHLKLSLWYSLFCLWWARRLGYRLVWTVHNVIPHEKQTADDMRVARRLSQLSDVKVVHSKGTLEQMRTLGIDIRNSVTIPHGNYIDQYPAGLGRDAFRDALKIDNSTTVLLFFGLIRPYKGVGGLIEAFSDTPGHNLRLIIVGKCADPLVADRLARNDIDPRVIYREGYVDDAEVQDYFQAADIVCLPFTSVSTSGSALLAASFGKPIVASRMGDLSDFSPEACALYDANDPNGLRKAIAEAIGWDSHRRRVAEQASAAFAAGRSWGRIAESTCTLYERLAHGGPAPTD